MDYGPTFNTGQFSEKKYSNWSKLVKHCGSLLLSGVHAWINMAIANILSTVPLNY